MKQILDDHKKWLDTDGREGKRANLTDADLTGADLTYANLHNTTGDGERLISLQLPRYWVCIDTVERVMQIGCERHTIARWYKFDDDEIRNLDGRPAVDWWTKYEPKLKVLLDD